MRVERRPVGPEFECDERIGVKGTLKDLELLTAGFSLHGAAAVGYGLSEFRALPGFGVRGNDETHRHISSMCVARDRDGVAWLAHSHPAYAHALGPPWGSRCQQHH
jgi:hypothetical protein